MSHARKAWTFQQKLKQAWASRGGLACALWPLSLLHAALVALRRRLYAAGVFGSAQLPVPVVVVGNVVAGGAGKTPLVMALVQHLLASGYRPGVISRGYGRQGQGCLEVLPSSPPGICGDEPLLIRQLTQAPVFVAARRADAARALLAAHPGTDIILCDDGLQHYALRRDLNIAVFDERGVGNGWLLPAGPLREAWPQTWSQARPEPAGPLAVRPVDLLLHTGLTQSFGGFGAHRALADHAVAADGRRISLESLRGEPLTALAGIAKPEAFFAMLRERGLTLERTLPLDDHIGLRELGALALFAGAVPGRRILCTQKDAVKLFALYPDQGLALLAVPLSFTPEPAFMAALDARLHALRKPA